MVTALPRPTATRDWRLDLDALVETLERVRELISGMSAAEFCADARTHDAVLDTVEQADRAADPPTTAEVAQARGQDTDGSGASDLDAPTYEPRTEPLRRDEAIRLLREHAPELEARFGIRLIALFGSVARDEARVDSDVDVLVEYVRTPGFREFLGSIDYLEALFRTRVDVGTLGALKARVRPYVHRDMIRVA